MPKKFRNHILLAEDDHHIGEVMSLILQEEGYTVSIAKDSQAIMKACMTDHPDIVFLDVRLGAENGETIAHELRMNELTKSIPLIMVSADNQTQHIAERVGADGFLLKPFELETLTALVKKHLRK